VSWKGNKTTLLKEYIKLRLKPDEEDEYEGVFVETTIFSREYELLEIIEINT
jgi:hypothetical protein